MADVTITELPLAPDSISPVLVPVSNGTTTYLLSAHSAPFGGNVLNQSFRNVILKSNRFGGCYIGTVESDITSNVTDYTKAAECNMFNVKIAPGVRDAGYKIGLGVQGYFLNPDFKGTLNQQMGIWCRHGFFSDETRTPTGTIENSYGIYIESLSGRSGAKINNCWGIYQPNTYAANAKNYLEGDTGIGEDAPSYKLHVTQNNQNKIAASIASMEFGERTFASMQVNTWYDVSRGDIHGMFMYKLQISGDISSVAYRYHEMGFNKSYPSLVNTVWGKNTGFPSDPGVQWQIVNGRYQVRITTSSWSGTNGRLSIMGSLVSMST